jgi:nitric oxide reductase activation protein
MDTRVFVNRQAAAPQRLRVHIMLDASASMKGETANRAVQAGRDLIAAMDSIPWIAARVYAQTDDYLGSGLPFVAPLWESGEKRDLIDDYHALINGNTPEGYCLAYVADDLLEDLRPSEKGVVIVISDGEPSYTNGEEHVAEVVGYYRRRGLRVVSVSVAAALREATQRRMYGNDFVAYNANVSLFARGLAKVIGSSL